MTGIFATTPPTRVDLRTTPPDNAHIWEEPRFKGKQIRPIVHWGIDGPLAAGPLALPGRYSVRLTSSGTTTPPERFTVTRATETTTPVADLVASTRAQIRVRDAMNASAAMINRVEIMRKQLEDQRKQSRGGCRRGRGGRCDGQEAAGRRAAALIAYRNA